MNSAKRAELENEILLQPTTGLTDTQIADKHGVTRRTVSNHKRGLKKTAKAQRALAGKSPTSQPLTALQLESGGDGPVELQTLLDAYPDAETMSTDDLMRALSIILNIAPPNTQVAAAKLLADLHRINSQDDTKGPPPPASRDDKIKWTQICLEAAGQDITMEALTDLWPEIRIPSSSSGKTQTTPPPTESPKNSPETSSPASSQLAAGYSQARELISSSQPKDSSPSPDPPSALPSEASPPSTESSSSEPWTGETHNAT